MQTWAKRGIQTALVTGGLLMLGTGIASADENVNPDSPAGPLDVNLSVPVDIQDNALGTLGKQINLPEVHKEISTKPITDAANKAAAPVTKTGALKPAAPATGAANGVIAKATDAATGAAQRVGQATNPGAQRATVAQDAAPSVQDNGDPFHGNKVSLNAALPILISGNALGVLGDAAVESDATQTYEHNSDVNTDGSHGGLAGNVVALDWALPVQISGNALGLVGSGHTSGSATQETSTTGDIVTDGTNGGLSGNVIAPQGATPLQVSGNALGWFLGHAETDFEGSSEAESGGSIETHGSKGAGTGNVAGVPVALPAKVSGNAISWGGDADVPAGSYDAEAEAGDTADGPRGPSYIQTDGDDSFLAGNVAQPQPAVPATVAGNAAAWIGNSLVGGGADRQAGGVDLGSEATSGGTTSTSGENAAGSGNIADAPVALPVEAFCVGGTWIGNAHANGCDNETEAQAGSDTFTSGNGSFLGGNSVSAPPAGTVEVFGVGGSWIGNASGSATETKDVKAGGYTGTLGNDSAGSGNAVQVPVAVPAEIFGVGGSWIGQGAGEASETKTVTSGGDGNTQDDNAAASANLVQVPVSAPVQVFGIGGAWIGQGAGAATTDTTSTAGGDGKASGKEGFAAGNLAAVPVSLPAQVHGLGAAWIGNGFGESENVTDSTAGGDLNTTGEGGSIAGNIVEAPVGAVATVFGDAAVWGGVVKGDASNDVVSTAGGDATTNGDGGSIAGDVIAAQALPVAQVFGNAASLVGVAHAAGVNSTEANSGGDITTSGEGGALSGDIFDVPAAAVAQVFGNAVSVGGVAHAIADNTTTGTVGGTDTTSGPTKALSGISKQVPLGVVAQVYDIPLGLIAVTSTTVSNATDISVAGQEPQIDLPITMPEMGATALPTLPALPARSERSALPQVNTLPVELPAGVEGVLPAGDLPAIAQLDSNPTAVFQQVNDLVSGKGINIKG
ncbi:beta strand repeat-containing protein [Amycolatopsis methanolica]|uniref:PE-PGRS family protein n=1 Tax=Amycolatopsis methanolica 239 TaxID=1068978 RepID=A0A076N752_AMYME|nr:hypothetical protein [Amycolatopsis methanolica]AIJ27121.1 hypothetical protein AMETH_7029 [Amycolatopsis methanolica 239]